METPPPTCEECKEREAEFIIRKFPNETEVQEVMHRALCKVCLAPVLANDTASIVRISKPAEK